MTVAALASSIDYIENGVTLTHAVPFRYKSPDTVRATRVLPSGAVVTLAYGVDYTVSPGPTDAGGTLTKTATVAGATLRIRRVTPRAQTMDYTTGDRFPAESHELAIDTAMLVDQEQDDKIGDTAARAWLAPDGETAGILPPKASFAGKVWGADVNGNVVPVNPGGADSALRGDLATATALSLVGYQEAGASAVLRTALAKLRDGPASVLGYIPVALHAAIIAGTSTADVTAFVQAALNEELRVFFPKGLYRISNWLYLFADQHITLDRGTTIRQLTADKGVFWGIDKANIRIEGRGKTSQLFGPGVWDNSWTTTGDHLERGIFLIRCDNAQLENFDVRNFGLAGVCINGGENLVARNVRVLGTNAPNGVGGTIGTPIVTGGNRQMGFYLYHGKPRVNGSLDIQACGSVENFWLDAPEVAFVCQGILSELDINAVQPVLACRVDEPNIHDIAGQHGFYMTTGNFTITNPVMTNINLSGVKVQAGDANVDITSVVVTGAKARGVQSQMFEISQSPTAATAKLLGIMLEGNARNGGRALGVLGRVEGLVARLICENCNDVAVQLAGAGQKDMDIHVKGRDIQSHGIVIYSTSADNIRLYPTLRRCNQRVAGVDSGIAILSGSANVEIFDPDVTDETNKMYYGLFVSVLGANVKVRNSARFTGAAQTAVRAIGAITEWPTEATLQGALGDYADRNVASSQRIVSKLLTTSATPQYLHVQPNLPQNKVTRVEVDYVATKDDLSESRAVKLIARFKRVGAAAPVLVGAVTQIANDQTGGFGGGLALQADGNGFAVLVQSGGAANYNHGASVLTLAA